MCARLSDDFRLHEHRTNEFLQASNNQLAQPSTSTLAHLHNKSKNMPAAQLCIDPGKISSENPLCHSTDILHSTTAALTAFSLGQKTLHTSVSSCFLLDQGLVCLGFDYIYQSLQCLPVLRFAARCSQWQERWQRRWLKVRMALGLASGLIEAIDVANRALGLHF